MSVPPTSSVSLSPSPADGTLPFGGMVGHVHLETSPSFCPPCAHDLWRETVRKVVREHPGWDDARVREEAVRVILE